MCKIEVSGGVSGDVSGRVSGDVSRGCIGTRIGGRFGKEGKGEIRRRIGGRFGKEESEIGGRFRKKESDDSGGAGRSEFQWKAKRKTVRQALDIHGGDRVRVKRRGSAGPRLTEFRRGRLLREKDRKMKVIIAQLSTASPLTQETRPLHFGQAQLFPTTDGRRQEKWQWNQTPRSNDMYR